MQRALVPALCLSLATLTAACAKKEAPAPPPPDVKVATVLQKDVPIFVEAIGQTRGSTEIEVRARVEGFIQTIDFKEGNPVRKGQLLYTIEPQPVRGRPRAGEGRARASRGAARPREAGRRPLRAARRQERHLAPGVRDGGRRPAGGRSRGRGGEGAGAERPDRPGLHEGGGARERPRGQDRGLSRHPRRPRAEHAAHAHLADRHDPRPLHDPRARLPLLRAQGQEAGAQSGPEAAVRAGPRATARCTPRRDSSCSWTATWTPRPARSSWKRRSPTRERSCGRGSTPACGRRWT